MFGEELAGINRRADYLFQTDALMPWLSALDNVALAQTLIMDPQILLMD